MRRIIATVVAVVLLLSLVTLLQGALPAFTTGTWTPAGAISGARQGAAAVLLTDGRILISGGLDENGAALDTAELFAPDGTFSSAAPMNMRRSGHAAILLSTGEVLVTGGTNHGGGVTNSAEVFDPVSNMWRALPATMVEARTGHSMAQMKGGNIVILGGDGGNGPVSGIEFYDVSAGQFAYVASLATPRKDAAVAAVPDGRILIAGGIGMVDGSAVTLASTEIFTYEPDTATGAVVAGPNMAAARAGATATTTYDGVAIVGGNDGTSDLGTAEIFSQWTNAFRTVVGGMARSKGIAILLPHNGSVLVSGGTAGAAVDLLQPWANNKAGAFVSALASASDHSNGFVSAAGLEGLALAAGGKGGNSAELYRFPTIFTDKADYAPGTTVVMTGTGFQPFETVYLHMHQWVNQTLTDYPDYAVIAEADGTFVFSGYAPTQADLNSRYHLTAIGQNSGLQAQTVFTDGNKNSILTLTGPTPSVNLTPGQSLTWSAQACDKGQSNSCAAPSPSSYTVNLVEYASSNCSGQAINSSVSTASTTRVGTGVNPSNTGPITFSAPSTSGSHYYRAEHPRQDIANDSWTPAQSACVSVTVNASVGTTAIIASSSNPSTYGDSVTFTAEIAPAAGSTAPTGSVQFVIDASNFGSAVTLTTGGSCPSGHACATISTSTLNAGAHTVTASYIATGNFNNSSGSLSSGQTVNKANAIISVTPYSVTYDDNAHTATGTAKGVESTPAELSNLLHLGGTTHTEAGDYTSDAWTFDGNTNYNSASGTVHDVIAKADATIKVNGYNGVYDGNAHGATGTATGVKGEDLMSLLNPGATFVNVPGGTADWTFAGNTNYKAASGNATIAITQAEAKINVSGYGGVYDGEPHGATGTATGVKGEDLTSLLNLGATFVNVPGGTADWAFAGNTNYKAASGNATIAITQAEAKINVSGYTGVYDGEAHGATGTATGVKGEELTSLLSLGATFVNVPGGTADWAFAGNTNYKPAGGTAAITINKADATIKVNGYTGVYDGNAHRATGSVTGVKGDALSGLDLGSSFMDAPGGTSNWTFTDATGNYNNKSGAVTITITQAEAKINVSGYTGVYDGKAYGATGTATGVKGEDLTSLLNLGATFVNVPGGTAIWAFAGNTNYKAASGTTAITINSATLTIAAQNSTKYLNAPTPSFSAAYDGFVHGEGPSVLSGTLACTTTALTTSPVGTYPITCSGQSSNNYSIKYVPAILSIVYLSGGICYGDAGHRVLQPINPDGTSVFKIGSTVPVKFRVCDANGASVSSPGVVKAFAATGIFNGTVTNIDELDYSNTPDMNFRWDSSAQQWIFNMSTKGQGFASGKTYTFNIALNDGTFINFVMGTK